MLFCLANSRLLYRENIISVSTGRLLGRNVDTLGLTHWLRIPLTTPSSRPQWERSLRTVMSHPTTSHIHPKMFNSPDMQWLTLGQLRLDTPEAMQKAQNILKDLKTKKIFTAMKALSSRLPAFFHANAWSHAVV